MNRRRLYRCTHDRRLAGVAGGLAEYLDLDPTLVRILWVVSIFFGGFTILLYIVMALIVPEEPRWAPSGGPGFGPGYGPGFGPGPAAGQPWGAPPTAGSMPGVAAASPDGSGDATPPAAGGSGAGDAGAAAWWRSETGSAGAGHAPGAYGPGAYGPGAYGPGGPSGDAAWTPGPHQHRERGSGLAVPFFGLLLILFGSLALAQEFVPVAFNGHFLWPAFILGAGVLLVVAALRRQPRAQADADAARPQPGSSES